MDLPENTLVDQKVEKGLESFSNLFQPFLSIFE